MLFPAHPPRVLRAWQGETIRAATTMRMGRLDDAERIVAEGCRAMDRAVELMVGGAEAAA